MLELKHFLAFKASTAVSLVLQTGEGLMIQGHHASGRSRFMKALAGHLSHTGEMILNNKVLTSHAPDERARRGIAYVPEQRDVFAELSVKDNLSLGLGPVYWRKKSYIQKNIQEVFAHLPFLASRQALQAKYLSGGEQQMLSIARAMISKPVLLLLDEPFEGLALEARKQVLSWIIERQKEHGMMVIWIEQHSPDEIKPYLHHTYDFSKKAFEDPINNL